MSSKHPSRVKWPPKVQSFTALGHFRDDSGNYCPRDIGVSSILPSSNKIIIQFGDTFCHNSRHQFLGLSNNTCAVVSDPHNPICSKYLTQYNAKEGMEKFNGGGRVTNLIEKSTGEENSVDVKWKIWSFSGVIENETDSKGKAWTFFEMWKDDFKNGVMGIYMYTGIAEVRVSGSEITSGVVETAMRGRAMFSTKEPRFGTFTILSDKGYLYTYGHVGNYTSQTSNLTNPKDIVLARVPISQIANHSAHTFFDGTSFVSTLATLSPVLKDMQHGQIFHTTMFGSSSPYRFAFIGNNAQGDSKVQMGRAKEPWGPWEVVALESVTLYALNKEDKGIFDFRYCVYPHPWGADLGKGDLMISWSEGGMTGGVLAGVVRFFCE